MATDDWGKSMSADDPFTWPEHRACRPASFDPEQERLGYPRSLYRDDCARALACARCGRLLPDPATSYTCPDGGAVDLAWCPSCSGGDSDAAGPSAESGKGHRAATSGQSRLEGVRVCAECGKRYEGDGHWCSLRDEP